jgi:hypothetical protein
LTDANKQSGSSATPDFSIRDEGSLILLTPVSVSGHEWADEHISKEGYQPWLPTRIIERRYFAEICEAILADSLVLA